MAACTLEPIEDSRWFLTAFCIGTPGIEVAEYLHCIAVRYTNLVIAHTDQMQLLGSHVETKLWYEPEPTTDLTDELRPLIGTTPLTAIVVDLQRAEDRALARKAVAVLVERNAFYIVVLPTPDPADELAWASLTYLQKQPGSLLFSQPADADSATLISPLTHSMYNVYKFCDILYNYDLPKLRTLMQSPGRLVVCTGRSAGNNRVDDALSDLKRYLHAQPFDSGRASRLHVQIGTGCEVSEMEEENRHLMTLVAGLTDTESDRCDTLHINDFMLGPELHITLLLWYQVDLDLPIIV